MLLKFPLYPQHDAMDCGPACIRMVSKFYGKTIPAETLRHKAELGKEGVNLLGMCNAAESIGFRAKGVRISYQQLIHDVTFPVILHWNQSHFVVLYKSRRKKLYIADPAGGYLTYTPAEFKQKWINNVANDTGEGIAMLLDPSASFYTNSEEEKGATGLEFKTLLRYVRPYKKLLVQLFLGLSIISLIQFILPFLTQSIVDSGIMTGNVHFIYLILLAQLALLTGRIAVEFFRSWALLHISTRINVSILSDFIVKLMKLPIRFFDTKYTGDILQRMNDHQRIESFLTGTSILTFFSLFNILIFSVALVRLNTNIFLVFLIASILYSVWVTLFLGRRRNLDHKRFEVASQEQAVSIQLIQGMQEIKLNNCENQMRWYWEKLQARIFKVSVSNLKLTQWQQIGAFFINESKNILITFLSASAVISGEISMGTMLAIQYIIGQLNSPIEQIITFIQNWQNAKISIERLNEIHKMQDEESANQLSFSELTEGQYRTVSAGKTGYKENTINYFPENNLNDDVAISTPIVKKSNGLNENNIVFRNVWFTYVGAGNEPVLKEINLKIPEGRTTAIVGISGSGKTTLLKLLLRFYEPQTGEIKYGNVPLNAISPKMWRKQCGVVMQESYIFNDTIARNIALGTDNIDIAAVLKAIEIANASDFINSLPMGLNTKIGSEGKGLSMGQRQRILIARAVYKNPGFILFDEATNSLDSNNESQIIRNLEMFFEGRTVIIVAHRLSTIKNADQIVVINNGTIVETGSHTELVKRKGYYFTLISNQLELGL